MRHILYFLITLCLTVTGCSPHRPADNTVPTGARARWQAGMRIFASLPDNVNPGEASGNALLPMEMRQAMEGALFTLTAHPRLPSDPVRSRRLARRLDTMGLVFAASAVRNPPRIKPCSEREKLRRRQWGEITKFPVAGSVLQKLPPGKAAEWIRTLQGDISGFRSRLAFHLASGKQPETLDCAAWLDVLPVAVATHSELAVEKLWPAVQKTCDRKQLLQAAASLGPHFPEVLRLVADTADHSDLISLCTRTGARFSAARLRELTESLPGPAGSHLALGVLCSDGTFLEKPFPQTLTEAWRLHLTGKTPDVSAFLQEKLPDMSFSERMEAGTLALSLGDPDAALRHFQWALGFARTPDERSQALFRLRMMQRFQVENEWHLILEQARTDPGTVEQELWWRGHWPAILLLDSGKKSSLQDRATFALQNYRACHPEGGPLVHAWERLIGRQEMARIWDGLDTVSCTRPKTAGPTKETPSVTPLELTDFFSDLARLLREPASALVWNAIFDRHVDHSHVETAAELVPFLHPDSPEHHLAAARLFLRKNQPDRAWAMVEDGSRSASEPGAWHARVAEVFLQAGYRHDAARAMRSFAAWHQAFAHPKEAGRPDLRFTLHAVLADFFFRAGFVELSRGQLTRMLDGARKGDPLRAGRILARVAAFRPQLVPFGQLVETTQNPLFLLAHAVRNRLPADHPGHLVSQLRMALPTAPEIPWFGCIAGQREQDCLDAVVLGFSTHEGIRLELLLDLLDELHPPPARKNLPMDRLALQAAMAHARMHSHWEFLVAALAAP